MGMAEIRELPCTEIFKTIKDDLFTIVKTLPAFYLKNIDRYAKIILDLWDNTDDNTEEKLITDAELHELLLKSNNRFRIIISSHLKSEFRRNNNPSDQSKLCLVKLLKIWPKQMKAWSPEVSAIFCDLLLWSGAQFPVLLKLVINHLNKIYDINQLDFGDITTPYFGNKIIQDYPKELLELLFKVLPNATRQHATRQRPFKIAEILQKIVESDSSLETDERYIELKRRYAI